MLAVPLRPARAAPDAADVEVKVEVELETATVEFEEDGKVVTHAAPVKLKIEAVDAVGFTLSPLRCVGPHYTMDLPPAHDMILQCYVKATKIIC